jgi:hypothetical protein
MAKGELSSLLDILRAIETHGVAAVISCPSPT